MAAPSSPGSGAVAPAAGDARFFGRAGPFTLREVAEAADGEAAEVELTLTGVGPLQTAGPGQVSFLDNRKYTPLLETTGAGAVIVHPELAGRVPAGCVAIVTPEPYLGWARVAALFHPLPPARAGRHPSAVVDPTARVAASAEIDRDAARCG